MKLLNIFIERLDRGVQYFSHYFNFFIIFNSFYLSNFFTFFNFHRSIVLYQKLIEPIWLHFFHHSVFITHHSSLNFSHSFGIIIQFPSLNIFHTICGPISVSRYSFFLVPKLTEANIKNKKKIKKKRTANPGKEKKKQTANANPEKKKKKKKTRGGQKLRLCGPLCVFNYNIVIELWVMETENSQKLFSVSITHNSKIRELSDENRVIVYQTNFLL